MANKARPSRLHALKHALAVTTRALACSRQLVVDFGAEPPRLIADHIRLPLPEAELTSADVGALRGTADQLALTYRYHSRALHTALAPAGGPARVFLDWAENARLAALAREHGAGVHANLEDLFAAQCRQAGMQGVQQQADAPLAIAAALRLRQGLTDVPLPPPAAHLESYWHAELTNFLDRQLPALRQAVRDQAAFGELCMHVAHALELEIQEEEEPVMLALASLATDSRDADSPDAEGTSDSIDEEPNSAPMGLETDAVATQGSNWRPASSNEWNPRAEENPHTQTGVLAGKPRYRPYTSAHDQVVRAEDLADGAELRRLREQLDRRTRPLQQLLARLSNGLEQILMAHRPHLWESGLDHGLLDNTRLASVIADPGGRSAYRLQRPGATRDTALTLLIDSSGSMHGTPIATAAVCADLLGQALERSGIRIEILGFTTADWRGGKTREQWIRTGSPAGPGRLNDLLHIIYKSANEPWRRTSRNLGLMLQDGLLKENIDGEALLWAHQRLLQRPEHRRILVVISDGLPADHSTDQENSPGYLEAHLLETINRIERRSPVELVAIGIGHEVSRFYRRSITIPRARDLAVALTEQLAHLFTER